jgi:outer membrane protein OmpA-like peptidoglycan-associated protein
MKVTQAAWSVISAFAVGVVLSGTGCATKKYVREQMSPVQQKVGDLDKKSAEQAGEIEALEKGVSRADERAGSADSHASAAAQEAARANEQASLASKGAGEARDIAEKGIGRAGEAERSLAAKLENSDNFKLSSAETILFDYGKSDLSKDAKAQLDAAAQKIVGMKHYIVEVQGFTDRIGAAEYNLELSRKRAAAVVRYLTVNYKIPLHRIHTMGYGSEAPAADNKTREGRKQNRRVEVRVLVAA